VPSRLADPISLDVYDLAGRLDRSVLLGDPGGGKTTAANVLMHHFARDPAGSSGRVPFLVTLRNYAAEDPPERSVAGHVEHTLETFYQCPAPAGVVDLLLLTGRAVVIFDGLDELLDTSRRADVTTRVERFCAEYPLAPVLVTSRLVGYDQARLDDRQFTCYRLAGFSPEQVGEYARKWFAQDADVRPDDAGTFLDESASVPDLRSNPLLLSLMCILYRGQGSLPRDRAGVYEQCADLLFRRWDARRRIHQDLRAGHLVEPALRHLAWWLFTRDLTQPVVTERELVDASTGFLHGRGFEAEEDARAAAREFVAFCRGRMWVFSDAGTTVTGELLYGFTHRTFLEYFAAAQLAYSSDSPEQLARALLPHIAGGESWPVAELAMQIKDRTSNGGAPRIYAALLSDSSGRFSDLLCFLALGLRSVDPSPQQVRELTRQIFEETCKAELAGRTDEVFEEELGPTIAPGVAFADLLVNSGPYREVIADEIDAVAASKVQSGDPIAVLNGLRVALSFPYSILRFAPHDPNRHYWFARRAQTLKTHSTAAVRAAHDDAYIRVGAIDTGLISVRQALDMPGGPTTLFRGTGGYFEDEIAYFANVLHALDAGWPRFGEPSIAGDLAAFGDYLMSHPDPPWLDGAMDFFTYFDDEDDERVSVRRKEAPLDQRAYLGAAALLLILTETSGLSPAARKLGPLHHLAPYLARRQGRLGRQTQLPNLLVPEEFRQTFRDWAEGRVDFTAPDDTAPDDRARPARGLGPTRDAGPAVSWLRPRLAE
jgi:hypothetical protein